MFTILNLFFKYLYFNYYPISESPYHIIFSIFQRNFQNELGSEENNFVKNHFRIENNTI
jgi:hypothetical protein